MRLGSSYGKGEIQMGEDEEGTYFPQVGRRGLGVKKETREKKSWLIIYSYQVSYDYHKINPDISGVKKDVHEIKVLQKALQIHNIILHYELYMMWDTEHG